MNHSNNKTFRADNIVLNVVSLLFFITHISAAIDNVPQIDVYDVLLGVYDVLMPARAHF